MTRTRLIGALLAVGVVLALAATNRSGPSGVALAAPRGPASDHVGAYNVMVEIDGVNQGKYALVNGVSIATEVTEYRSGSDDAVTRKRPGRVKYGDITLKRGFTGEVSTFEKWHRSIVDGSIAGEDLQRNITLTLYNQQGRPIAQWSLFASFPTTFTVIPATESNGMAIEKIEIAVEKVERVR